MPTEAPTTELTDTQAALQDFESPSPQGEVVETPETTPTESQQQQTQQTKPPAPSFSREDVANLLKEVIPATQPAQVDKTYTQDELNKMFNVFAIDEAYATGLGLAPEALPLLIQLRDGLIKQANTYVEARLGILEKALNTRYQPMLDFAEQQRIRASEDAFYAKHKDLADHKDVVSMVLAHLQQQGHQPKTAEEAATLLADTTRTFLKNKGVVLAAGDGASQQQQTTPTKMASLSGGGQGTAGRSTSSASAGGVASDLKSLFG